MAKYFYLVMVSVDEAQDAEFNDWLDNHHAPEVVESGGFVKCHRFELAPEEAGKAVPRYMHIYELETDDFAATQAKIDAKRHLRTPKPASVVTTDNFAAYYKAR